MTEPDTALAFQPLDDRPGFEIVDRIEQERCIFHTEERVSPTEATTEEFRFPVDHACKVTVQTVSLPNVGGVLVRDEAGEIVAEATPPETTDLSDGRYMLELVTHFKTYARVNGDCEIRPSPLGTEIEFSSPTEISIGALSNHDRPTATVTTTEDPVDMMAAVETFGSSLKTTKPDRSLPSLRGHPPAVELGDSLEIPPTIEKPETGVRIELPARREAVYVSAPLVHYLGANVEPGPVPRLVTDTGFEYSLASHRGFETDVEETLKQVFVLDCITRTEGHYNVELRDRKEIERKIDLDIPTVYERSLPEQLESYLDIPFELVEDHVPEWRLTTHVEPVPDTIEQLPYVVDDLAIIRTGSSASATTNSIGQQMDGLSRNEVFTRSTKGGTSTSDHKYVEPDISDSMEQAWIGENIPIGASKLTKEAFENRFAREPTEGNISITIVLNDARMDEERDLVNTAYGTREDLPFDVDVHRDQGVEELRELLEKKTSFLHYIGHIEQDGFECADGKLDTTTLENTNVDAFLLNACNSYEQGLSLVEAGAVGGIVTLNDVINEGAVRIGESIARLLNFGFPLRAALTVARGQSVQGGQYIVVGDGGMTVALPEGSTPFILDIQSSDEGFEVDIESFTTDVTGLGTMWKPYLKENQEYYLSSGQVDTFEVSHGKLKEFVRVTEAPMKIDQELHWPSSIDLENFNFSA